MPSFLTNFLVRFHAPRGQTPYARRNEILPCSLHNHFFLLLLAILSRKADTTRRGPQTLPSHMYPFLQPTFYFLFIFFYLEVDGPDAVDTGQPCLITQTKELFIMPMGSFSPTSVLAA